MIFHSLFFANFDFSDRLFRVNKLCGWLAQGCRYGSNPGLQLANAFGVFIPKFKLTHHQLN